MADFVVGASLKAARDGSLFNGGTLVTSPIPFSGLRSINCGSQTQNNGMFIPSLYKFEYSFYNDFTIEMFLRGDGTTNDGGFLKQFGLSNTGAPDGILLMIEGDELQLNNYDFPATGYRKKIGADIGTRTTTDWYHVACVRKNNKYSLFWNGNRVAHDIDSAGNGTADYIDIQSNDAYLFKPIAGNKTSRPGKIDTMQVGNGGNKPSDQSSNFLWGGYIANYRTSYIAQYDPSSSTYTVPSAPFSNFSGTTTYYKDSNNSSLFNESDNLPTTFNDLVLENTALGSVTTVEEDNVNYPIKLNTNFAGIALGNINTKVNNPIKLTGISLTSSLSSVGAGLGVLVPVTQLTANTSLESVNIPIMWSKIQTGITTNWKEVDTG